MTNISWEFPWFFIFFLTELQENAKALHQRLANICSGNGLVLDGTKPLPEKNVDHVSIMISNWVSRTRGINSSPHPPGQNVRHFTDDVSKCIFFNENCCVLLQISLKYICKVPINKNPALVQIMAWCWTLMHYICGTRGRWVKVILFNVISMWQTWVRTGSMLTASA